jgi:hypothetical protein
MTRRVKVTGDLFHGQVPAGAVYVGRAAPGLRRSPYANPFKVGRDAVDAAEAVRLYREWLPGTDLYQRLSELTGMTSPAGAHPTSLASPATPMCCWSWPTPEPCQHPSQTTLTPEAREASERLTRALITIASRGLRTHCSEPDIHSYWLSEDPKERAVAARLCRGCPVIIPCAEVGQHQRWGVWGGVDRSPRPYKINSERSNGGVGVVARIFPRFDHPGTSWLTGLSSSKVFGGG